MYGILWTKKDCEPVLGMCGRSYAELDAYLEDGYMHSWHFLNGYHSEIVSVHKEGDKWVC